MTKILKHYILRLPETFTLEDPQVKKLALTALALFSLQTTAKAEMPADFAVDAIINGQKVPNSSRFYKTTVMLVMLTQKDGQSGMGLCSGTLIGKQLVLTAAHCVKDVDTGAQFVAIAAVLGNGQKVKAEKWLADPSYSHVEDYIGFQKAKRPVNDIALIKLEQPAGEGTLLSSLPAAHLPLGGAEDMVIAGYGRSVATDPNSITTLNFEWTSGALQHVRGGADYQIEMTGVQPCSGDSGGPIFRAKETGPLTVLGVISHVKGQCESSARAISISHHLNFVRNTAAQWGVPVGK